ncbi:hypothetical protein PGT21_028988 [Puccinia graminis f. sp. tritici]|uniref:Uncharacterized protein n=2 Tax=Puccinia graminis f. sp. tritici TaxID=56615 RepID=H6QP39_PUCGT|nr:uncharacterized protein PGTG_20753 [Puccinia graminis f. sp. tritici CRL 75-36-700-3]EHS63169.1 hypothetical protein PGTG_20753 [Puccinia graminis f. sp. tritici CRL 75-36-700-3]KAA1063839.1 hypothetical protein PGTUg99_006042 [Puccinia graminis f. sp. tritici]KAA1117975.1 hypothetical protein PGT21_028988 [Puccinia graminis f. sp. tritici]
MVEVSLRDCDARRTQHLIKALSTDSRHVQQAQPELSKSQAQAKEKRITPTNPLIKKTPQIFKMIPIVKPILRMMNGQPG